ncbi:MAG: helix-turn-helix domain-containing protein [Alphaproteobacteria bacterium]|nr:helix-turn-helix domain-containing protein [Alphaproteobacteria bacterium]
MSDDTSSNLARNVRQLRELRGFTQAQVAKLSGVPRPTIANLESGEANPTLSVLVRVASALQVSIEELISPPRASVRRYRPCDLPVRVRNGVEVRQLLPDPIPGLDIERMALPAQGRMSGVPHTAGTREYLTCERGRVRLSAAGETFDLDPGDVVVFRGDQRHGYAALDDAPAVAYSVVMPGGWRV